MKKCSLIALSLILVIGLCFSSCNLLPGQGQVSDDEPRDIVIGTPPEEPQDESGPSDEPQFDQAEQDRFDDFLERDFRDSMTSDGITLHMNLRTPENFGITDFEVSWGYMQEATIPEQDIKEARDAIEEFRTFDRAKLDTQGQESYDLYAYDADLFETWLELYYYDTAFQGDTGIHMIAPIILSEYSFWRQQDLDNYMTLCSQFGQMFDAQLEFEKIKAEKGLFMSDRLVDYAINGCREFISKKDKNILIVSFKERLDDVDFISEAEKEEYLTAYREIFDNVIVTAYETVITELEQMKGSGNNEMGLAHYEKGKEYYKFKLKNMGISNSPDELISIVDNKMDGYIEEMVAIMTEYPDVLDRFEETMAPELTPEELIEFLREKTKDDFPALPPDVRYTVKQVDESLKDFAPAFYISPQLDYFKENSIYYNPDYAELVDQMYFIMAHEGIPGHMLQTVNLYSSQLSDFRKAFYAKAYIEGWAQYVEYYSYKYLGEEDPLVMLMKVDTEMSAALTFRVDLGVNYEGWSFEDMKTYIGTTVYNTLPDDVLEDFYFSTIKNPIEIAPYAAGRYEIENLKEQFKAETGSAYSERLFHEEFLKRGPAPIYLVQEWMMQAIKENEDTLPEAA